LDTWQIGDKQPAFLGFAQDLGHNFDGLSACQQKADGDTWTEQRSAHKHGEEKPANDASPVTRAIST
jgi:hypothetical protein